MAPTGIILYGRDQHVVCSIYEKLLDLGKNDSFRSLTSVALTDSTIFASDREARCIYELDLTTGSLMKTISIDGQPMSLSLNQHFLLAVDSQNSIVYLFDRASLATVGSASLKSVDQVNGALNAVISEDNLVFVRNSESQITLLDGNLEPKAAFNEIQARLTNLAIIRDQNYMMAIGGVNNKQQFKIFGYMV